jgi:hypothetical protein
LRIIPKALNHKKQAPNNKQIPMTKIRKIKMTPILAKMFWALDIGI